MMLERWLALVGRASDAGDAGRAEAAFEDLRKRYSGAERHYHDFRHIEACLRVFDSVADRAEDADAVELAIWFHDAVYDSHRSDNEEASAGLAVATLGSLGVGISRVQTVSKLILVTRHSVVPTSGDEALLMDIDLSILGKAAGVFDEYECGVRREYEWVAEEAFRAGRAKVLRSFLARPRIYFTDFFYDAFETAARVNLNRSLMKLAG